MRGDLIGSACCLLHLSSWPPVELLAELANATAAASELPPGRDAAFRRIVLEVYDYTCAACGARLVMGDDALVEAAHIIPFSVGRNDKPTNGLALCPNHHWAMDRCLIAPCPDARERDKGCGAWVGDSMTACMDNATWWRWRVDP